MKGRLRPHLPCPATLGGHHFLGLASPDLEGSGLPSACAPVFPVGCVQTGSWSLGAPVANSDSSGHPNLRAPVWLAVQPQDLLDTLLCPEGPRCLSPAGPELCLSSHLPHPCTHPVRPRQPGQTPAQAAPSSPPWLPLVWESLLHAVTGAGRRVGVLQACRPLCSLTSLRSAPLPPRLTCSRPPCPPPGSQAPPCLQTPAPKGTGEREI